MSERWLRWFQPTRRDPKRDVDDEIQFHLEARIADLVARGARPDDARRQAIAEFGDADVVRADTLRIDERIIRRDRRADWVSEFIRDARIGLRSLLRTPAYTITTVSCAALGIGVTGAIVSASYSILVRPLPYPHDEQLVAIYGDNTVRGYKNANISWPDFISWRDRNQTFTGIGIFTWNSNTITGGSGDAERVTGSEISPNLFAILGVHPAIGRLFLPDEDERGRAPVALISHRLWMRRFGGDSTLVGRTINLDGRAHTLVGVMSPGFNFPDRGDVWVPFKTDPAQESHGDRGYAGAIGRIKPGVSVAQATADLHRVDAMLAREFPNENFGWQAGVVTMRDNLVGDLRRPLQVFLVAVVMVLLTVCANLANLMLARGALRGREVAIRAALGASRGRIVRQLMTESIVTALLGGVLGIAIAWWGVRLLRFAFPDQSTPFYVTLGLDDVAIGFIVLITLITGILFGSVPALRTARANLDATLREGSRSAGTGLHRSRLRAALVVSEIALSVVLMVGAALLARSYKNLAGSELGFDEHHVLSARITLPTSDYATRGEAAVFYDRLFADLRRLPNVVSVGSAQGVPFSGWDVQGEARIEGSPPPKRGEELISHFQWVTPDYFKTIGVSLVRGRWFTAADRDSLNPVVLVNELMVAQGFGGRDPIGKRISAGFSTHPATVVGVIRDFRHYRLPQPMGPAMYAPYASYPGRQQTVVIRTTHDHPQSLIPEFRSAVRAIDKRVALYQVQTFDEVVSRSLWRQRLQGNVVSVFAVLALCLACIGLYGVISYAVAQRTRELGVRIALGASRGRVVWLVGRQSARLVISGVAVGLLAAYFAVGLLSSLLYGVRPTDPGTFALVPAILAVVALLAAVIPAARAARVDPIIAMRSE
ncbi:MAG TPA: ABC transporter permease [Gemmatimonadaceae bacterium]|nr:ABC transporter permease [Gemmatimonadaceae bacterium]